MKEKFPKIRLDVLLVDRGLVASRERARALILAGAVLVREEPVDKAGTLIAEGAAVRIRGGDHPYVSRGGVKLKGVLDAFGIQVDGFSALDVGASTGGFTDCLLQEGARKVYAVDVGYGQIARSCATTPGSLSSSGPISGTSRAWGSRSPSTSRRSTRPLSR
jgi:23S rRNA (cytidine1920-2'-O)/16S rRNA (cytidine1409-2'-O)-methyltransferase